MHSTILKEINTTSRLHIVVEGSSIVHVLSVSSNYTCNSDRNCGNPNHVKPKSKLFNSIQDYVEPPLLFIFNPGQALCTNHAAEWVWSFSNGLEYGEQELKSQWAPCGGLYQWALTINIWKRVACHFNERAWRCPNFLSNAHLLLETGLGGPCVLMLEPTIANVNQGNRIDGARCCRPVLYILAKFYNLFILTAKVKFYTIGPPRTYFSLRH